MSKKQIRSRLESLFIDLAENGSTPTEQEAAGKDPVSGAGDRLPVITSEIPADAAAKAPALAGWTWEIDASYRYVYCGLEVSDALRMNPQGFIGKDIFSYGLQSESKPALEAALRGEVFPVELTVLFDTPDSKGVSIRINILSRLEIGSQIVGWRGFSQRFAPATTPQPHRTAKAPASPAPAARAAKKQPETRPAPAVPAPTPRRGVSLEQGDLRPASGIWTDVGKSGLERNGLEHANATPDAPAAMAMPLKMQGVGDLLLEIVDDSPDREWSEDDRTLVMEIASQLALALDNAQLYKSVQQELAERIHAEQVILRRNRDLAALNQTGQQLSRLATPAEIYNLLASMIGEILTTSDLYICSFSPESNMLSFPVFRQGGQPLDAPDQPFGLGIPEHVIRNRAPLLVTDHVADALQKQGVPIPAPVPASLLAIPMIAGDQAVGAIVAQDFLRENAFDAVHVELLSTAAAQATTALENAILFQQMQSALEAIETRERYQANVARAAAILTEYGTKSLPDVLKALGQAAQCSRVYFAQLKLDERGQFWAASVEWTDPTVAYRFDKTRLAHIPVSMHPIWVRDLQQKGWTTANEVETSGAGSAFLNEQRVSSHLMLAVPGSTSTPSFLAFDQVGDSREWHGEEISALRVAADAVSNTFVREGLLEQLQVTLDETEGLYKASNRLAVASDMQEMVSAVLSSVRAPELNRAVLLLFDLDAFGKVAEMRVGANWYSGRGTPPPPVGLELPYQKYERLFQTSVPVFYNDVLESQISKELQETLTSQNIRALAILPLWSGKRQIGAVLLEAEASHRFAGRETRTYPPLVDQMAISVENQRLFEQTQVALSETELLNTVSNRIAQAGGAQDMVTLVVETMLPTGADRLTLLAVNSDPSGELIDLEVVGHQDAHQEYQPAGARMPVSAFPLIKSLTDEPLIIADASNTALDPASQKALEDQQATAACLVPMRAGGRLIGVLIASSRKPTEFHADETRLMRIAGSGIAVAMEKQRLLRQAQRRALELQTASEIARDTASTLSLDLLLERIVNMLSERFGFSHASIFLLDETRSNAVIRESTGAAGRELKQRGHRLAVGSRSVVGTVTATGNPFILNDTQHSPMHFPNPLLPDIRSEMGVPLKLGATVIGAIDLQSRELNSFNQDDVTVLQILADQIAIAIENAQAYELSQKAIADMKEVDRMKSQFLANMSHELRTPLNSIIGFSRVILKGIDGAINDTQKQDLSAIYNSGQHLLSLITDILDLSKIEAGKMELSFVEVNLVDLINSAMSTAVGLVKDKPIRLKTFVPDSLPPVRADNTRVRQVLINFLSNAAKFTDEGEIIIEAALIAGPKGQTEVMVSVTDSGPGIAAEDQNKLFLPFSQVDDSPTRKTGGTGLGLSICRSLIELHHGRIGLLRSEVGKGSTFFFTLPVNEVDHARGTETEQPGSNVILAIDDDPKVISLYQRYLKTQGYRVVALTDPKLAVARASELQPFAITLDIMMPEKDGWTVMRELKNHPETRQIPIVICSILDNQEKGFSMGAADYLVKPFLQEDMVNTLNRLNSDGNIQRVLVIDDDAADLRLVKKMLEEGTKFQVITAQGGKTGWELIQVERPDAIVLDLFMPEVNGFNILENLRADAALRHIPVIVLTGADLTPEQHQQLTEFDQGVVTKGFLQEKDLLAVLEETLKKFQPSHGKK